MTDLHILVLAVVAVLAFGGLFALCAYRRCCNLVVGGFGVLVLLAFAMPFENRVGWVLTGISLAVLAGLFLQRERAR